MKQSFDEFHAKQPDKGNSVKEIRDKEVSLLKMQLKKAQNVSKAIWKYRDYLDEIKEYLRLEQTTGAKELFDELDCSVQKLLMTATTKGGPFTVKERAVMRSLWDIKVDDIDGTKKEVINDKE